MFAMGSIFAYFGLILISSVISLVFYLLTAIGIYKMGKNLGISNPWLSFIPVVNIYAFGKIAERYIKLNGRPSAKFSKILLTIYIIFLIVLFVFVVFLLVGALSEMMSIPEINAYVDSEMFATSGIFTMILPILLLSLGVFALAVVFLVVKYVALWRIYALYDRETATLFLVLSLFFSFLEPIFLFVLRNREAELPIEQPVNIM